jgi:hypothetical protein
MLGRMLRFGWLVLAALAGSACQGDYPLPPSACDEWCATTENFACGWYDPADCVAQCEAESLTAIPECREPFASALQCFRSSFDITRHCRNALIGGVPDTTCAAEYSALSDCVALYHRGDFAR